MTANAAEPKAVRWTLLSPLMVGLLSGFLLFDTDYPLHLWPLLFVAFLPVLAILARPQISRAGAAFAGFGLSLGYILPLVFKLQFPLSASLVFIAYFGFFWTLFGLLAQALFKRSGVLPALAVGALAGLVDFLIYTVMPVWGTAQSIGKVLIDWPWAMGFVSHTGLAGVAGLVVALQALVIVVIRKPQTRRAVGLWALVLITFVAAVNAHLAMAEPVASLRVGAVGFFEPQTADKEPMPALSNIETHIRPLVAEAARLGARVVATPEFALRVEAGDREQTLTELKAIAKQHEIWLFSGVFDKVDDKNRVYVFSPDGESVGHYEKVHLIYTLENYNPGDGTPLLVNIDRVTFGTYICQDDNFPDVAAAYAKKAAQVMVVPTFDWSEVKDYHFENSRVRSVEHRYAILRAAMDGISAIIAPGGEVIKSRDVFASGDGVVVADLPIPAPEKIRTPWPLWFPIFCGLVVLIGLIRKKHQSK
jgi:apolipoprotein N-acyltransferase